MYRFNIEEIRSNFRVNDQVLKERAEVGSYIRSFSNLIVDRMIEELSNEEKVRLYLANTEMNRFKKTISGYLSALFCDSFDQQLISRIEYIGNVHYSVNLLPEHLALGYDVLREVIIGLAAVNDPVRSHLGTILKFLHLSEFIMQNSFYSHTIHESRTSNICKKSSPLIEKLYQTDTIHKQTMASLEKLYESDERTSMLATVASGISGDPQACQAKAI